MKHVNGKYKLTENEEKMIRILSENGRTSVNQMSKILKLRASSVTDIKSRLEDIGIIKGYVVIVDWDMVEDGTEIRTEVAKDD